MKSRISILFLAILLSAGNIIAQNFALDLDGVNDKIGILDSPELNPSGSITVEAWINAEEWQTSIWAGVILSKQGSNPDKGYCLSAGENGRIEFTLSIDEGWKAVSTPALLGTNAWYHVAGVYNGSQLKIYINGELMGTEEAIGTPTTSEGVVMNIGDNPTWPGRYWNGKVDEVRIWEVARTQTEIQEHMSNELTGTETGLVAYYPMNEGTGTTTEDMSSYDNTGQLINMDESSWVEGFQPVTADVGIIGIASPSVIGNGFSSVEKIKVEIKNFATEAVSNFNVGYSIDGSDPIIETINVQIEPFATYIYTFNETVNLSGLTEITLTGTTELEGDLNPDNNELTETISPTLNYTIYDKERHNYGGYGQTHSRAVYMPEDLGDYKEIYLNISLYCPTGGCDPWDQPAKVIINKDDETYEIARYITPFGKACGNWTWDITDFRALLTDKVEWTSYVQVWGSSGWLVSIDLEFVEGTPEYPFVLINKLWAEDNWVYGDPAISYDFPEIPVYIFPETDAAKIRMTTTGHGQANTNNAAEFANFTHHVYINGEETFTQHLWNDDCGQNDCSNQSGTWTASRAGWCPGQDVQPWEWDMAGLYTPGQFVDVDYVLHEYTNLLNTGYNGGSHTEPYFRCHAYFVQYADEDFVGIGNHNTLTGDFKAFPNPTTGRFSITTVSGDDITDVEVYNMSGILVKKENNIMTNNYQLDLSNVAEGMYFVNVSTASSFSVIKTVVVPFSY